MNDQPQENSTNTQLSEDRKTQPQLYSKRMILVFSLLFSSVFSAVLLMANLKEVGKMRARLGVLIFAIAFLVATGVVLQVFQLPPNYSFVANVIGAAILNEYFWNKYIGRDTPYEKKSWIKPTLISLGIAFLLFSILFGQL